ncbi:MAG TPA: ABC transporter permease [Xanthobacteraceae bacterium]|nr:ABC transporter permease [Xanthobacteraceae bacterium]
MAGTDPIAVTAAPTPGLARRLFSNPAGLIGTGIVLVLVALALFAPQIAPFAPTRMGAGKPLLAPSLVHLAGTDEFGRDMFSRIVFGARFTLMVGAIAVGISLVVGLCIGLMAAYARGWVEIVLMRLSDVLFSFTETLIALACVAVLGPSLQNAMIAVGIAGIPLYARTAYAAALVEAGKPYFEGSVVAGAGPLRLLLTHLLPNVLPTMIVIATLGLSSAILAAAGLSFLGLGAQPPTPEWGAMLSAGRDFFNRAPWLMLYPGLAIAVVVLGFNLLGDGLRHVLDPKGRDR